MARLRMGYLLKRGRNLADLIDAAAARLNLGLGSAATQSDTRYAHRGNNLSDLGNAGTARTNLGLGTAATKADTRYAHRGNNLSDLGNAGTARNNLGLGSAATQNTSRFVDRSGGKADGLHLQKYFYFVDYDFSAGSGEGLKCYVRDGVLRINQDLNEGYAIQIELGGQRVWHQGNAMALMNKSVGAVGTYALASTTNGAANNPGGLQSGSNLRYLGFDGDDFSMSGSLPGTWRAMGRTTSGAGGTVWVRIS